jgi:hypothetical protein
MRRGLELGAAGDRDAVPAGDRDAVPAPGRRTFLGVGIGCALPLIVGPGLVGASGLLQPGQGADAADPIWDHIASEAWRTCQEVQGPMGVRGEHLRRLGSQIDLFAVHLGGCGFDRKVDDEIGRLVRERGREGAAFEILDHHRGTPAVSRFVPRRRPKPDLDPEKVALCLDEMRGRGVVKTLRLRRGALERAAARLDRQIASTTGRALPASMVGQKPGDDFPGLPEPQLTPEDICDMLRALVVACTVAMAMFTIAGQLEVLPAIQALQALAEVLIFTYCGSRNE